MIQYRSHCGLTMIHVLVEKNAQRAHLSIYLSISLAPVVCQL
jgi:hypothetical protein